MFLQHHLDRKVQFGDGTEFPNEMYAESIGRDMCMGFCRRCAGWALFEALLHDPNHVRSLSGTPDRPFQQIPLKVLVPAIVDVAMKRLRPMDGEAFDNALRDAIRYRMSSLDSHSAANAWWTNDMASPFNSEWILTVLLPFIRKTKLLPECLLDPASREPVPRGFAKKAKDFTHRVLVLLYIVETVPPLNGVKILLPSSSISSEGIDMNLFFLKFVSDQSSTILEFVTDVIDKMKERHRYDDIESVARQLNFLTKDQETVNRLKDNDNPRGDGYIYNEGVDGLSDRDTDGKGVEPTQPFEQSLNGGVEPTQPSEEWLNDDVVCSQLVRAHTV